MTKYGETQEHELKYFVGQDQKEVTGGVLQI